MRCVCRKGSDRRLKVISATKGLSSVKKATTPGAAPDRPTTADDKSAGAGPLIAGQLTIRRQPRVDIDALMMDGVKQMDVIWHTAADAAEAMQARSRMGWKAVSVMTAVSQASKKLIAKKLARQQRKLLQQLSAGAEKDVTTTDDDRQTRDDDGEIELAVSEATTTTNQSCRRDLLRHLLSAAPPHGVSKAKYDNRR